MGGTTFIPLLATVGGNYNAATSGADILAQIALSIIGLGVSAAVFAGLLWFVTLPLRHRNRARAFLDAFTLGLRAGRPPEKIIAGIHACGKHNLGRAFDEMAQKICAGNDFLTSLNLVPEFLPPQARGILYTSAATGDLASAADIARQSVTPGVSRTRAVWHHIILFVFYAIPLLTVPVAIMPKFETLMRQLVPANAVNFAPGIEILAWVMFATWTFAFIFFVWADSSLMIPSTSSLISRARLWLAPWRRKRCRQRFSLVLGQMLEAGVPESRALRQAAEATGEDAYIKQAAKGQEALAGGSPLSTVVTDFFDPSGELGWRLNSFAAQNDYTGLRSSLEAWGRYLDAAAFRDEQVAAQISSTVLFLLAAAIVADLVISFFFCIITLMQGITIW